MSWYFPSLSLCFLLTACSGASPNPVKSPSIIVVPTAAQPVEIVLDYKEGVPSNYLDPAILGKSSSNFLRVGKANPDGPSPARFDLAFIKLQAWNQAGESMMADAQQELRVPMIAAPKELQSVLLALHPGEKARYWTKDPESQDKSVIVDVELLRITRAPTPPENLAAAPEQTDTQAGGVRVLSLVKGEGTASAQLHDKVTITYATWSPEGELLDASMWNEGPTTLVLSEAPAELQATLKSMVLGDEMRLWIPAQVSGSMSDTVMDLKLTKITSRPTPPTVPEHVAKAPKHAKRSKSGLRYEVVVSKRESKKKPSKNSVVRVHYTGWTTDGKMFDSSVTRGEPAEFPLDRVIAGWTEGVQLMRPGQTFRFWIPESLAYEGRPGAPSGMLVFEVELVAILP